MQENYQNEFIRRLLKRTLEHAPDQAIKSVNGYSGAYKYFSFGDPRASYFIKTGERAKTNPEAWFDSIEEKKCLVLADGLPKKGEIDFASAKFPYALKATLLHRDVLPGLWKGQELDLRFFLLADCLSPAEGDSTPAFAEAPGDRDRNDAIDITDKIHKKYRVTGRIKSFSRLIFSGIPDAEWARFVLETSHGSLEIFRDISETPQATLSRYAPGEFITCEGPIFADAASGEYKNGAVYNVEYDLIILREAFVTLDFERCRSIFADECVYIVNEEVRAKGSDAILQNFERVADLVREKGHSYTIKFGGLTIEDISKAGDFKRGQRCLLFITPDNQLLNAIFAWTDAEGKIVKLESIYYFKEEMGVYVSSAILDWLHGSRDFEETPDHED